jgi:hypothetical protein
VDAVPGDVQLAALKPGRPLGAARQVDDLAPRLEELDPDVVHDQWPEPLRVFRRAPNELPIIRDLDLPHEA